MKKRSWNGSISIKTMQNGVDFLMDITFCGGAGEVGASCYLVQMEGKNLLLDCGIRMSRTKDVLPDFSLIQDYGGVDAIFITHAHLDHTGSLPIISREYPNAPIYMTHATKDLVRLLLYDSLKIMDMNEGDIPIYAEAHVRSMLSKIICYSPEFTIQPFEDVNIRVTFYNAGHIAGGSAVYIQGSEGSLFYSGDISMTNQRTVSGASIPRLRPDAAIIESTYGDKLHANREVEEDRLTDMVKGVILQGGKVLIPAFALGRAQEIILILKRAMNKGTIPKFNIFVDGMVRDICRIYSLNPNYLKNDLAKRIWKGNDIFFDDFIQRVENRADRDEIIASKDPCCIISSSGMLNGGPSQWYAQRLAGDEKNFIAITGYQDEEAPGRILLNLIDAPPEERVLRIDDTTFPVKCGIGKYNLSAHADSDQIMSLVHALSPKRIFFVHGEGEVIMRLGQNVQREVRGRIYLPANGERYDVRIGRPRKQLERANIPSMKRQGMPEEQDIKEIWAYILNNGGRMFAFSAEQIIYIWKGNDDGNLDEIRAFMDMLSQSSYFEPDAKRPFLFRPLPPDEVKKCELQYMELNQMLSKVDEFFPPSTGLYKKGARHDEGIAILYFDFPPVAEKKYGDDIKRFEAETGWKVELNQEYNMDSIERAIYSILPKDVYIDGKISYYRDQKKVKVKLMGEYNLGEVINTFYDITGLTLDVNDTSSTRQNTPPSAQPGQMEQNAAFSMIDEAFRNVRHRLYKKGLKQDDTGSYIELSFISPEIGISYDDLIKDLSSRTRWDIRISPNPNQNEILKCIKQILFKKGLYTKKNPSIYVDRGEVRLYPADEWNGDILECIKAEFKEATGYDIIL